MKEKIKFRLRIYSVAFSILMAVGIAGFMVIERLSLIDAVYFSIATMATVGYGDIYPKTDVGKILAMVIIIGGVGTFLGVFASITDLFVNRREEEIRQQKINIITGLFFSEMGNELMKYIIRFDSETAELQDILNLSEKWGGREFEQAGAVLKKHRFTIDSRLGDIPDMLNFLQSRSTLLLRLIENPTIQEHEDFTELLRALFHLRDELVNRTDLVGIPDADRKHLEGDIARVYHLIIFEWLRYIRYLKENYGYLFSLALRINPFNPNASAVVGR
jgi:hypothetical protein